MNVPAAFAQGSTRARFTLDEFVRIYKSGALGDSRLELIDGEIERMAPAMGSHFNHHGDIYAELRSLVGRRAVIKAGIAFGNDTMLACDVALLHALMEERRFLHRKKCCLPSRWPTPRSTVIW